MTPLRVVRGAPPPKEGQRVVIWDGNAQLARGRVERSELARNGVWMVEVHGDVDGLYLVPADELSVVE